MNRSITIAAAALAAALLAGCATTGGGRYTDNTRPAVVTPVPGAQAVHPLARSMAYTCEDLTTITLTEGQSGARAMLNSGLELGLARVAGNRYGAGPYEFRPAGAEGVWINQGKVNRCRAK